MSAAPRLVTAAPDASARTAAQVKAPALGRRLAGRLANEWLPRAAWTIGRTGRPGLAGLALLLAAAVFLVSTHLKVAAEVETLRAGLAAAQGQAPAAAADKRAAPAAERRELPARAEMPAILRQLFAKATHARLAIDTGKYEIDSTKTSSVVRHQISFPVSGPYPQIRAFIDATLSAMPEVALSDLVLERKSIADGSVDAQIRMTVFTRSGP